MNKLILKNGIRFYDFKDGHGIDHIQEVIYNLNKLMFIAEEEDGIKFNKLLMMTAALYHDAGRTISKENHHIESANIVRNEEYLKEIFSEEEIELIALMCEEHRSSMKKECSNIYSALLNDADSLDTLERIIERTYKYHLVHDKAKDYDSIYNEVYKHLKDKFGTGGYHRYRTKYAERIIDIDEIHRIIDNEPLYKNLYDAVIENIQ